VTSISAIGDVIRSVDTFSTQIAEAMERQSSVTQEISRTVVESAHAAREVATQIVGVSNEAVETGRRAADIRVGSAEIAGKVDGLRATLVRVVRTSTADVNRRLAARTDLDRRGTVEAGGRTHRVLVRNLSESGAMLVDAVAGVAVDSAAVVTVDGLVQSLRGTVVRNDANGMLIKFEPTGDAKALVMALISGRRSAA
jgi:PilZ domain